MKLPGVILVIFLAGTLMSCEGERGQQALLENNIPGIPADHVTPAYSKPGAPVLFSSNYDGQSVAGVEEQFEIQLNAALAGELTVKISSTQPLIQGGEISRDFTVAANETVSLPLVVIPPAGGKFYINIIVTLDTGSSAQSRAFALAIVAPATGDESPDSRLTGSAAKPAIVEDGVIILPAEETIRVQEN